jgi:nitrite reductase (NADH) small subunit
MPQWVRLCQLQDAPPPGQVAEAEAAGVTVCLANIDGELRAMDNLCPHRGAPLGQGSIEGDAVMCPWHAWLFDTTTGVAAAPERGRVAVFSLEVVGDAVMIDLE